MNIMPSIKIRFFFVVFAFVGFGFLDIFSVFQMASGLMMIVPIIIQMENEFGDFFRELNFQINLANIRKLSRKTK
jgi:hypothetical protein